MDSKDTCRNELRLAIRQLTNRGLYSASKWVSELLLGIEQDPSEFTPSHTKTNDPASTPSPSVSFVSTPVPEDDDDDVVDSDFFLLAKSYFDCKEYRRAAHALRGQAGRKSVFLRCYALYLAGEKRKEEEIIELEGPLAKITNAVNRELVSLERELSVLRRRGILDPFGLYLYGLVLKEKGNEDMARAILVESVNTYPWNWNAWSVLQSLCTTIDMLNSVNLNNHWMKDFFFAKSYEELRMHKNSLDKYVQLQKTFSYSSYIKARMANVLYHLRDFDQVKLIFEELLRNDPYRIEDVDVYSNVLYDKGAFSALSRLAHNVSLTEKYRPQSCYIIGNYYRAKGPREKAILYFKRTLMLDKNYVSAWTLMGHEYFKMQKTKVAIEAYRRAVDVNPRDYRAWYGLGQAYETMVLPHYALFYFKQSLFLEPNDPKLLVAMARCYESHHLHMLEEAIKCYKRVANRNDLEVIPIAKLARLYERLGQHDEAAIYYKIHLERLGDGDEKNGPYWVDAMLFFAKYCIAQKRYEEATMYCDRLVDYCGRDGHIKQVAMNLLRIYGEIWFPVHGCLSLLSSIFHSLPLI